MRCAVRLPKRGIAFATPRGARLIEGFRPFDGMEDLEMVYRSDELLPLLANRVLSASRPEYADFLRWHGFDPADPPEPLLLLQRSEGIKKTDAIEVFPCPVPDDQGCYLKSSTREGGRDERFLVGASRLRSRRSQISDPHP